MKRSTFVGKRVVLLVVLVPVLAAVAIVTRWQGIEEWWYGRQSTAALRATCSAAQVSPVARFIYGGRLLKAQDYPAAALQFQQAADARPTATDSLAEHIYAQLGRTLVEIGDSVGAVPALKKAAAIDDDDPTIHIAYALIFADRRQFDYAEPQLRIATNLDPSNPDAWYLLGRVYDDLANPQAAVPALERAVALAPRSEQAHLELGHAYAFQSLFKQAIVQFRSALMIEPNDRECRRALGAALGLSARSHSEYEEAARMLDEISANENSSDTFALTIGQLHLRFQNLEKARFFFRKAISIKPSNADAWYNLARTEVLSGRKADAEKADREFKRLSRLHDEAVIAEKRVSADVKNAAARIELSRKYRAQGNLIGAYWQLRTAMLLKPDDPEAVQQLQQVGPLYKQLVARQGMAAIRQSDATNFGPPPPVEYSAMMKGHR